MIPAAFDYQPGVVRRRGAGRARRGRRRRQGPRRRQSLLPLMKLRLAQRRRPLIDIGRLDELKGVRPLADGGLAIGALTTYAEVLDVDRSSRSPSRRSPTSATSRSATAARSAGPIAHADPASDLPALGLALDYSVVLRSSRGERVVPLDGFFEGAFQTGIAPDELLVAHPARAAAGRARRRVPEARAAGVRVLDRRRGRGRREERRHRSATSGSASPGSARSPTARRPSRRRWPARDGSAAADRRGRRARDRRRHRQQRHPRGQRVSDRDGRGLHATRARGRAGPLRLRAGTQRPACGVERITPGRRAPGAPGRSVLARDLTIGGERWSKGRRLIGGRPACRSPTADHGPAVTVLVPEAGELHEDDAALRLATAVAGPGLTVRGPAQSRVDLLAAFAGRRSTCASPSSSGSTGSTRSRSSRRSTVRSSSKGDLVASVKVAPHVVDAAIVDEGARVARLRRPAARLGRAVHPGPGRGRRQGVAAGGRPRRGSRRASGPRSKGSARSWSTSSTSPTTVEAVEAALATLHAAAGLGRTSS